MNKEIKAISKIISSDPSYWGDGVTTNVVCPECGYEYVHFESPVLEDSEDNYKASWDGRGDLLVIPMWAECGAKWETCYGFHKGYTGAFIRLTESCKKPGRFVYFIEAVGLHRIKIGVSDNPEKRIKQLSTGSPVELKLIATIAGDSSLEKELHDRFKHLKQDKEWFHLTKELNEYIMSLG